MQILTRPHVYLCSSSYRSLEFNTIFTFCALMYIDCIGHTESLEFNTIFIFSALSANCNYLVRSTVLSELGFLQQPKPFSELSRYHEWHGSFIIRGFSGFSRWCERELQDGFLRGWRGSHKQAIQSTRPEVGFDRWANSRQNCRRNREILQQAI